MGSGTRILLSSWVGLRIQIPVFWSDLDPVFKMRSDPDPMFKIWTAFEHQGV